MRKLRIQATAAAVAFVCLAASAAPAQATTSPHPDDDAPGVYLKLVEGSTLDFEDVSLRLEEALQGAGWKLLTRVDCGVDASACEFRSRVLVAYPEGYIDRVMAYGVHAASAIPIRFVVFEDENGVNVGSTNPMNLNRTIVDESTTPADWADVTESIRALTRAEFPEWSVETEYGQMREKARIGRTMGVVAGGKWTDKFQDLKTLKSKSIQAGSIARMITGQMGSLEGDWKWGLKPVYTLDLPEHNLALIGVAGEQMEAQAFGIVRHGGDEARADMACPGISHSPAFPLELLVYWDGERVHIQLVDAMYRMKMYFEDAGKVAFMKNMGMPGSIKSELEDKIDMILR